MRLAQSQQHGELLGIRILKLPSSAIVAAAQGMLKNDATRSKETTSHTGAKRLKTYNLLTSPPYVGRIGLRSSKEAPEEASKLLESEFHSSFRSEQNSHAENHTDLL